MVELISMEKAQIGGYLVAGAGFCCILVTALSYLLDGPLDSPVIGIIGLVLVVVGLKSARRCCRLDTAGP
jgi:hypothetical protein